MTYDERQKPVKSGQSVMMKAGENKGSDSAKLTFAPGMQPCFPPPDVLSAWKLVRSNFGVSAMFLTLQY